MPRSKPRRERRLLIGYEEYGPNGCRTTLKSSKGWGCIERPSPLFSRIASGVLFRLVEVRDEELHAPAGLQ